MADRQKKRKRESDESEMQNARRAFSLLRVKPLSKSDASNMHMFGEGLTDAIFGAHNECNDAVISNMMIDSSWLLTAVPKLCSADVLCFVRMHKEELRSTVRNHLGQIASAVSVEAHEPPLPYRYGSHHSKFTLITVNNRRTLRLALFTANFILQDCSYKAQAVWAEEFPLKAETGAASSERSYATDFEQSLHEYLKQLNARKESHLARIVSQIPNFDFSGSNGYLIPSVPGRHRSHKYGLRKIKSILGNQNAKDAGNTCENRYLSCVVSSIGSLKEENIAQIENAFGCKQGSLSIGWPSMRQVADSYEGLSAGNSIPAPMKNVLAQPVLKRLHRFDASHIARDRAMPHIKAFGVFHRTGNTEMEVFEMSAALITSHNLSNAALGREVKKDGSFEILSFELGILFTNASVQGTLRAASPANINLDPGVVNVPFIQRQPPDAFYRNMVDNNDEHNQPFAVDRRPLPSAVFYRNVEDGEM